MIKNVSRTLGWVFVSVTISVLLLAKSWSRDVPGAAAELLTSIGVGVSVGILIGLITTPVGSEGYSIRRLVYWLVLAAIVAGSLFYSPRAPLWQPMKAAGVGIMIGLAFCAADYLSRGRKAIVKEAQKEAGGPH